MLELVDLSLEERGHATDDHSYQFEKDHPCFIFYEIYIVIVIYQVVLNVLLYTNQIYIFLFSVCAIGVCYICIITNHHTMVDQPVKQLSFIYLVFNKTLPSLASLGFVLIQ